MFHINYQVPSLARKFSTELTVPGTWEKITWWLAKKVICFLNPFCICQGTVHSPSTHLIESHPQLLELTSVSGLSHQMCKARFHWCKARVPLHWYSMTNWTIESDCDIFYGISNDPTNPSTLGFLNALASKLSAHYCFGRGIQWIQFMDERWHLQSPQSTSSRAILPLYPGKKLAPNTPEVTHPPNNGD